MRIPDPIANTTTEAYLAYKAGVLAEGDLKPKLYDPYIHLDAWLAYWAGLTNEYPLDKNGDPEMLTDEEALIAYLSGVTDTYPEEFRDPADVRVAAYLKYLVSARWGRPEYPVTNEELYLSMMDAPYIPAGEPSSDIEIDDTAEAPFRDVKMYGDTSQTTYTGKNLFNIAGDLTYGGYPVSPTNNGDGTLTTTANYNTQRASGQKINCISGETYTVSGKLVSHTGTGNTSVVEILSGLIGGVTVVKREYITTDGPFSYSFVAPSDVSKLWISFSSVGASTQATFGNIQIEAGSTATSFEPYVGGVPAPNPDYPQAVNTVTGRQMVKVEGKNLWYVPASETQSGGVSFLNNGDGTFDVTGTNNLGHEQLWRYFATPEEACIKDGETYTLSVLNAPADLKVRAEVYKGTTWVKGFISRGSTATLDMSGGDNLRFSIGVTDGTTMNAKNVSVQLEKGSTPTDFIPYQSGEYEINLGKNLLDNTLQATTAYSGTITTIDGSTWTVVKPANGGISLAPRTDFLPVNIKAGESVTFSSYPVSGVVTQASVYYQIRCYFYDKDENLLDNISTTTTANDIMARVWSTQYTPTVDVAYIKLGYYVPSNSGTTDGVTLHLQLERGSTPTSYAPYFTPIELCKLGNYQDYIYMSDGKWYVHKAVGKVLLDSSEGWTYAGKTNVYYSAGIVGYALSDNAPFADYLKGVDNVSGAAAMSASAGNSIAFISSTAATRLYIKSSTLGGDTTGANLRAWLSAHNVSLYYALATPTDTEITNTALIDQLNALKNGGSYTGTTYIKVSATDPNLPGLLEVEAYKYD